jgi:hypothetical protein
VKTLGIDPPQAEFDRIAAYFAPPAFETGLSDELDRSDPDFAVWIDQNVSAHKAPGYAVVNDQPQADRRHPRRRLGRPDRPDGRSRRALQLRRAARHPRPEHRPAARPQGRSLRLWQRCAPAWPSPIST